jgi:hypothetical protein
MCWQYQIFQGRDQLNHRLALKKSSNIPQCAKVSVGNSSYWDWWIDWFLLSKKLKYRSYLYYNFYSGDIPPVANSRFPSHSGSFFASHNADLVINNQVARCCKCCLSSGGDLFNNSANPTIMYIITNLNMSNIEYSNDISNILCENQRSRRLLFDIRIRRSGGVEYS